jgi:hypothetical protein
MNNTSHGRVPQSGSNAILEGFQRIMEKRRHSSKHEQLVQDYIERFPQLLPGLFDLHNCPAGGAVVTKPSLGDFTPDFADVSQTTASYQFTLIEIEERSRTHSDAGLHALRHTFLTEAGGVHGSVYIAVRSGKR